MSGYAAIHREVRDHPFFKGKPDRLGAWVWLILSACWSREEILHGGEVVKLEPGWLFTSDKAIADNLGWSLLSVRRCLRQFEQAGLVSLRSYGLKTLILITDRYTFSVETSDGDGSGAITPVHGIIHPKRQIFGREREAISRSLRLAIIARDGAVCQYCGRKAEVVEIDHIHPVVLGGGNNPENLCVSCPPCNRSKGAKLLEQWQGGHR